MLFFTSRYHFKITLCSKRFNHDWNFCPYAHQGKVDWQEGVGPKGKGTCIGVTRIHTCHLDTFQGSGPEHGKQLVQRGSRSSAVAWLRRPAASLCHELRLVVVGAQRVSHLFCTAVCLFGWHTCHLVMCCRGESVPPGPSALQLYLSHLPGHAAEGQMSQGRCLWCSTLGEYVCVGVGEVAL